LKKIILALLIILPAFCNAEATELVKILKIAGQVNIKTPDGESINYKNTSDIPEFLYGSRVTAVSGQVTIRLFKTIIVTLEKHQGICITKNPVTKNIEIFKLDVKGGNDDIKVQLAGHVEASFGADSQITLFEEFPSSIIGVRTGTAIVKGTQGRAYVLFDGDHYEAKQYLLE